MKRPRLNKIFVLPAAIFSTAGQAHGQLKIVYTLYLKIAHPLYLKIVYPLYEPGRTKILFKRGRFAPLLSLTHSHYLVC